MKALIVLSLFLGSVAHAEYNDKLCKERIKTAPKVSGPIIFDDRQCEGQLVMQYHFKNDSYLKMNSVKEDIKKGICESDPSPWSYTDKVINKISDSVGSPVLEVVVNKADCK